MNEFGLHHDSEWGIGRFDAFFSGADQNGKPPVDIPKYIRILIDKKKHCFKTVVKKTRRGIIYINPSIYEGPIIQSIDFKRISAWDFYKYRIRYDRMQQMALAGLCLALLGVVIDGILTIDKANYSNVITEDKYVLIWMIVSIVLKLGGLILLFIKGLKETK